MVGSFGWKKRRGREKRRKDFGVSGRRLSVCSFCGSGADLGLLGGVGIGGLRAFFFFFSGRETDGVEYVGPHGSERASVSTGVEERTREKLRKN